MSKVINEYVKWVGKTDWELKNFMEMNITQ